MGLSHYREQKSGKVKEDEHYRTKNKRGQNENIFPIRFAVQISVHFVY